MLQATIDDVTAQQEVIDLCDQWRRMSGADFMSNHALYVTPHIRKSLYQLNVRLRITRKMLDCATNPIATAEPS